MKKESSSLVKVNIPDSTRILPRERLFQLLDNARERPITWVSGPAGSGKTSLVASYVKTRDLPCLWYQVDARDADLATFFYYMGLAAKKAAPRYRSALPLLTSEYLRGIPTFTLRYFEELFRRLKPPFTLVFDNYQDVPEHSEFHKNISHGLSAIPQGSNVIFISRSEPPPEFARLRASSQLNFIGWDELRFNLEESERFAEVKNPKRLPDVALKQIVEKTEGWAAGLVLMLEGAGAKTQAPNSSAKLAQGVVFDYFAGEVFDKLDSETRNFLLMTAFLPKITIGMAVKLTGMDNADRILAALNRSHFFTEKHTTAEPVYQYHPLFREFLLTRTKESLSSEGVLRIQKRAAELLEEAGQVEDAVLLFCEAQDWEKLVRLILGNAQSLMIQGRSATLSKWLVSMPEEIINNTPWLLYWKGVCKLPYSPAESRVFIERAFQLFESRGDEGGLFLTWSGVVESIMHELSDLRQLDRWIALLDKLLHEHSMLPSGVVGEKVASIMFMSLVMRNPQHPDFTHWRERAFIVLETSSDTTLRMFTGFYLLTYYLWIGEYTQAAYVLEMLRGIAGSKEVSPLAWITVQMAESWYQWLTGAYETSRKTMSVALETARESGVHIWDYLLLIQGVAASLSEGDLATAESFLKKLSAVLDRARRFDQFYYHFDTAWYAFLRNDLPTAFKHQETALRLSQEVGALFIEANGHLGMAQLMHEQEEYKQAREHLAQARRIAAPMKSAMLDCVSLLTEAYFAIDRGDEITALKSLRDAMALGRKHKYVNFTWWRPSVMSRLCVKALEAGIEVEYVRELIRRRNLIPETSLIHIENWPWPTIIYTLGRFEIVKEGKPVEFSGKVQKKPLAMLKAIIALGGREAGQEQLTDILWPESEGDAAHMAFKTTLHRLRKLMGNDQAIRLQEGCLSLDDRYCWVDAFAFHQIFEKVEAMRKGGQDESRSEQLIQLAEKAMGIYRGHFLADDVAEAWAVSTRERLKNKFIRLVDWLGHCYEETGQWKKAMECYENAIEADERHEEFYRRLMLCNKKLGRRAEALAVYQRCRNLFKANGIKPSPETEALHKELRIMGS